MEALVTNGTDSTNPAPNTLVTKDPYGLNSGLFTPSDAWVQQGLKGFIFIQPPGNGLYDAFSRFDFDPTDGALATFTAAFWRFNRTTRNWFAPKDNNSFNMVGPTTTVLQFPDNDAWFLQLSNISGGQIRVYYDADKMRLL